jgi:hypothetical protein
MSFLTSLSISMQFPNKDGHQCTFAHVRMISHFLFIGPACAIVGRFSLMTLCSCFKISNPACQWCKYNAPRIFLQVRGEMQTQPHSGNVYLSCPLYVPSVSYINQGAASDYLSFMKAYLLSKVSQTSDGHGRFQTPPELQESLFRQYLFIASSLHLHHFYFSIDILSLHYERRRTNGKTVPLLSILFISCLPWLTITFYIYHFLFVFRFATTMTATITMTTTTMTTRPLPYIAYKGCFKIFKCKNMGKPLKFFLGALSIPW